MRTPIGRYGGALAHVRADDLAALPIRELMRRNPGADWSALDDVILGCANQAGEDNRNVARMACCWPASLTVVPGTTMNRLCGSGMDAVGTAARAIACGEAEFVIAGGVESMSRAPFVMGKAESRVSAFGRDLRHHHRLAIRESPDARDVRNGFHAGDRRERGARLLGGARSAGCVRVAQPDARGARHGERLLRGRDRAGGDCRKKEMRPVLRDEHPRPDTTWKNSPRSSRCSPEAP